MAGPNDFGPTCRYKFNTKDGEVESRVFNTEDDLARADKNGWKSTPAAAEAASKKSAKPKPTTKSPRK